jgi:two-component system cell cycle sensor histidine kinase/response regulator CckA
MEYSSAPAGLLHFPAHPARPSSPCHPSPPRARRHPLKNSKKSPARPAPAAAARVSAHRLAAALGSLAEGVLLADPRWRRGGLKIVFSNDSLCSLTGRPAAALCGRPHGDLHADHGHFPALRRWLRRPAPGYALSGEGYLVRADGARLYAAWTFSAVAGARGRVTHVAVTYRDMTAKRRLQEELIHTQRLDAVGRLAGGVAHDFNNLLSVINGYCEILAGRPAVQSHAAREIEEIHRAGRYATGLVRQLLAFSRRRPMDSQVVSLNQLVRDNAGILAKLLRLDKTLTLDLAADPDRARVDPTQLQQVLLNLTLNARDALAPGGEVVIRTRFHDIPAGQNRRPDLPPGRYAALAVRDNGSGMDAETRAHLFEPFHTTKDPGKGTGLGLALVYGVVQQSGGHIFVESAPGAGTTFEIFLPAVQEPVPPPAAPAAALPATGGSETILLVEEDTVVRKMVAGILTADGYRVLAAATPAEALGLVRLPGKPVEVLIAALHTLDDDTDKLARALHAAHPGLCVLATGNTEPPRLAWLAAGSQGGLTKPFVLSELLRAVRSLLKGRGMPSVAPHFTPPSRSPFLLRPPAAPSA